MIRKKRISKHNTRTQANIKKMKRRIPALQEVGGSFWISLSSFNIRFEAITTKNNHKKEGDRDQIWYKDKGKKRQINSREGEGRIYAGMKNLVREFILFLGFLLLLPLYANNTPFPQIYSKFNYYSTQSSHCSSKYALFLCLIRFKNMTSFDLVPSFRK